MGRLVVALAGASMSLTAGAACAHHSFAMFDPVKEQVITGTATQFQWTNPHSWIELDVAEASGKTAHWSIEAGSPLGLKREGWSRESIRPGDKISLVIHPMKDGSRGGSLMGIVLADGRRLGASLYPANSGPRPGGTQLGDQNPAAGASSP
jgi:hypothetical protein